MMNTIGRREFLGAAAVGICAACAGVLEARYGWLGRMTGQTDQAAGGVSAGPRLSRYAREAMYYTAAQADLNCQACHTGIDEPARVHYCHTEDHEALLVRCDLCPHGCVISDGARGFCRVRENRAGTLYTLVYGNPCTAMIDPIEKKPFFHFYPTQQALSIATAGCPLRCLYCQNWQISQATPEELDSYDAPPDAIVMAAVQQRVPIIAYTYSEPIVFYEYMFATARLARENGIKSAIISSGYINEEPLRELCKTVDAIKIDLKGFDEDFYRQVCQAERDPVLHAIETVASEGVHLEIVNLVVPTLNDSEDDLRQLADWLLEHVGPDVPVHFSRFMPQYQLENLPPTPIETITNARTIALEAGLRFVYTGNVPGHDGEDTYCPACGAMLIDRLGFYVLAYHIEDGACEFCGEPIPGVWGRVTLSEVPLMPDEAGSPDS